MAKWKRRPDKTKLWQCCRLPVTHLPQSAWRARGSVPQVKWTMMSHFSSQMTPGTFLLWYDLDQHFVSIRFCGKIGYWTHLWRSVHESKQTSWYVLDCPRPHGSTHIRVKYHPGDMCGDPGCGLVCQGGNQCLQTGAVCVTSPCCPAHACSSTINKKPNSLFLVPPKVRWKTRRLLGLEEWPRSSSVSLQVISDDFLI